MKLPVSLAGRWLTGAATSLDRAAVRAAMWNTHRSAPQVQGYSHEQRMARLAEITSVYGDPRFVEQPESFFPRAQAIEPRVAHVREFGRSGRVVDVSWPSGHAPLVPALHQTYGSHRSNKTAHARLFLHGDPRPAVIAIHGYMGGQYLFEERAFPVRWMFRHGLDVALVTLPFHGVRSRLGAPLFPGADPRFTIEGCRQAVGDILSLAGYLRRRGSPSVGVIGMSLGGYVTALLATLEEELAFAVPIIPLASFADVARDQGRFGEGPHVPEQYAAYDEALRVISPFARPNRLPGKVLVLAGAHDRITPKEHAERLAEHFEAPLVVFPGGHLLQIGRGEAFEEIERLWRQLGVLRASHHRVA
jgi:pimeloyl-ACP methyl ester carboxylesterase